MISPEQRAEIRRLYDAEHWRVGTIATTLGVHHDTVRGGGATEVGASDRVPLTAGGRSKILRFLMSANSLGARARRHRRRVRAPAAGAPACGGRRMMDAAPTLDLDGLLRRLHLPTVRRLYPELAQRAEGESLAYREFLAVLIAEEVAHRAQTRIQRGVHRAHFPFLKTVDEYDFTFQSGVRLSLLGSALSADFITQGQSLIFSGPSGTGKTHLAIAIAYRAIQNGFDALFTTATALIEDLSATTRAGKLRPVLPTYTHPAVLVIDEVGYLGYGADAANVLFQVVNDRYLHHRPMIFTTNKPLAAWGRVLHDADLAEAILDRVLERGRHLELRGRSYRTRHAPLDLTPASEPPSPGPVRISGNHRSEFSEPTARCPVGALF